MKRKPPFENFSDIKIFKQVVTGMNSRRPDYCGLPHETMAEFLARGGKVKVIENHYQEMPTRYARPTHPESNRGQSIYEWRV